MQEKTHWASASEREGFKKEKKERKKKKVLTPCYFFDDHLYSAILRSLEQSYSLSLTWYVNPTSEDMKPHITYWADSLRSPVFLHEWQAFFIARFLNIHRSGVLTALAWLVPHETADISAQVMCTPYNHASCHFMQSHIRKVYASLAQCNLPPALLEEWPGSFTCYCGNTGVERIPKLESAQKVDPGEENSPAASTGIWTRDLSVTSQAL